MPERGTETTLEARLDGPLLHWMQEVNAQLAHLNNPPADDTQAETEATAAS